MHFPQLGDFSTRFQPIAPFPIWMLRSLEYYQVNELYRCGTIGLYGGLGLS